MENYILTFFKIDSFWHVSKNSLKWVLEDVISVLSIFSVFENRNLIYSYLRGPLFYDVNGSEIIDFLLWFTSFLRWFDPYFLLISQGSQVQFSSSTACTYPRSPALPLGLTAAVALMIAQVMINIATGCICCRRGPHPSNSNWTLALICFVVSW